MSNIADYSNMGLTVLDVPEGYQELQCSNNQLTSLNIPAGYQKINCSNNQLTSLDVPEGCQEVLCSGNNITTVTVPKGWWKITCFSVPEPATIISRNDNQEVKSSERPIISIITTPALMPFLS